MRKSIGALSVFLAVFASAHPSRAVAGIIINQGESFTNSCNVVLNMLYPPYTYAVTIATKTIPHRPRPSHRPSTGFSPRMTGLRS